MVCGSVAPLFNSCLRSGRKYLDQILTQPGPFADDDWIPGEETIDKLEKAKVLSV